MHVKMETTDGLGRGGDIEREKDRERGRSEGGQKREERNREKETENGPCHQPRKLTERCGKRERDSSFIS